MPKPKSTAWDDLIYAIALLSKHRTSEVSPFHCEHDQLTVLSDPSKYTPEELAQLDDWGFHFNEDAEDEGFYSFRFGSA
ncbi:hypothetical protein CJ179_38655 [Rhodococcus sp. ACS1]|uniref:hypothetical protein n=1 Tax=Rhodococcus sp. ACS1 TaxID=2028570 RepID=UPI000BB122A8|nr:hypothetical protein [Rhodococcus sp. ACS1]PBC38522.1 hypothetical protein CJ179_38655 [Rhodococcus sp. ACS1]